MDIKRIKDFTDGSSSLSPDDIFLVMDNPSGTGTTKQVSLADLTSSILASSGGTPVIEINDLTSAVTWANVPDANITESSVVQHEAAITVTESQISDLDDYIVLNDLSVTTNSSGVPALSYNNTTGEFSYTPPDLSNYLTEVNLDALSIEELLDVDFNSVVLDTSNGDGKVLAWNQTLQAFVPVNQTGGISLTDLSIGTEASASGDGSISYNDTTGVFTYTPPDLTNYLIDVVDDLSPQLGGNLDLNNSDITGTGNIDITGNITATGDIDATVGGFEIGYRNIPQITLSSSTTLTSSDSGKHYYSTLGTNTTITIPSDVSVNFSIGTAINIINLGSGEITITEDSGVALYFAGTSSTGSRVVSAYGAATLQKVESNKWFLVGVGVS